MQKKARSAAAGTTKKVAVRKQSLKDLSTATKAGGVKGGAKRAGSIILNTSYATQ